MSAYSFVVEQYVCLCLSPSVILFCPEDVGKMSSTTMALVYLTLLKTALSIIFTAITSFFKSIIIIIIIIIIIC